MSAGSMTKELEGFFISLGFDVDDAGVKRMSESVASTVANMRGLVTVAGLAAGSLATLIGFTVKAGEELGDFSEANGVSAEAVQELGFAAAQSGSDIDAVKSSVSSLNATMGEAALGIGRGKMTFDKLGLSAKDAHGEMKTFDVMLVDISEKMKKLSLQESIALARKVGVDSSLVPLLRKGGSAIEDLRLEARALGVQSDEQIAKTAELATRFKTLWFAIDAIKTEIITGLFPATESITIGMKDWILQNRDFIRSGATAAVQAFGTALGHVWRWTRSAIGGVVDVVKWLAQFRVVVFASVAALGVFIAVGTARVFGTIAIAVFSAAKALMAFNFSAMLIPALIGATILAVGILIDDFFVWKEGGKSLLEDVFGKFPDAVEKLKLFLSPLREILGFFGKVFTVANKLGDYLKTSFAGVAIDALSRVTSVIGLGHVNPHLPDTPNSIDGLSPFARAGGLLGSAASSMSNTASLDNSTKIQELNITVNSPNSADAGRNVMSELERRGMIMTRNSQSQVLK